MAAVTKTNNTRISTISLSSMKQKLESLLTSQPRDYTTPIYSDEEYYRDLARKEVQQRIEKAKYSIYFHRGM